MGSTASQHPRRSMTLTNISRPPPPAEYRSNTAIAYDRLAWLVHSPSQQEVGQIDDFSATIFLARELKICRPPVRLS